MKQFSCAIHAVLNRTAKHVCFPQLFLFADFLAGKRTQPWSELEKRYAIKQYTRMSDFKSCRACTSSSFLTDRRPPRAWVGTGWYEWCMALPLPKTPCNLRWLSNWADTSCRATLPGRKQTSDNRVVRTERNLHVCRDSDAHKASCFFRSKKRSGFTHWHLVFLRV